MKIKESITKLKNQLFGKNALTVRHTHFNEITVFENGKEKTPKLLLSKSGDCKISVFKLALILLGVIFSAVLIGVVIASVAARAKKRKEAEKYGEDEYEYLGDSEPLPF